MPKQTKIIVDGRKLTFQEDGKFIFIFHSPTVIRTEQSARDRAQGLILGGYIGKAYADAPIEMRNILK